jgi:hypothetical protein
MQKKKNWRRDAEDQTRYGAKHDDDFVPDEVYGKWELGGTPGMGHEEDPPRRARHLGTAK